MGLIMNGIIFKEFMEMDSYKHGKLCNLEIYLKKILFCTIYWTVQMHILSALRLHYDLRQLYDSTRGISSCCFSTAVGGVIFSI